VDIIGEEVFIKRLFKFKRVFLIFEQGYTKYDLRSAIYEVGKNLAERNSSKSKIVH
jgi:hypothetical protein